MSEQATNLALLALNRISDPGVAAEFFEIPGVVNVDQGLIRRIFDEREANGEFSSIDEVQQRVVNVGKLLSGRLVSAAERFLADPGTSAVAFDAVGSGRLPEADRPASAAAREVFRAGATIPFAGGLAAGPASPASPRNAMDALLDAIEWTAQSALVQALLGKGPPELKPVVGRLSEVALQVARGNPFVSDPELEVQQRLRQVARQFRADQARGERQPLLGALVAAIGEVMVRSQVPGEWAQALARNGVVGLDLAAGFPPLLLADGNGTPPRGSGEPPRAGKAEVARGSKWEFQMNIVKTECVQETLPDAGADEFRVAGSGTYRGAPVKADPFARNFDSPGADMVAARLVQVPLVVSPMATSLTMTFVPFEEDVIGIDTAESLLEVLETLVAVLGGFLADQARELLKQLREGLPAQGKLAADALQLLLGGPLVGLFLDLVRKGTTFVFLNVLGHDPFLEYRLEAAFFWPDAGQPPQWMARITADGFPPTLDPQRLVTGPRVGEGRTTLAPLKLREFRIQSGARVLDQGDYTLAHELFLIETR